MLGRARSTYILFFFFNNVRDYVMRISMFYDTFRLYDKNQIPFVLIDFAIWASVSQIFDLQINFRTASRLAEAVQWIQCPFGPYKEVVSI